MYLLMCTFLGSIFYFIKHEYTFGGIIPHHPASYGWAIIGLRLKHRGKLIYYNVDIKHSERDLVLQCLGRSTVVLRRTFIHLISNNMSKRLKYNVKCEFYFIPPRPSSFLQ
jgi:hypothetical protein